MLDTTAEKGQELQSYDHQVEAYSAYLTFVKVYARLADGLIPIAVSSVLHRQKSLSLTFSRAKGAYDAGTLGLGLELTAESD